MGWVDSGRLLKALATVVLVVAAASSAEAQRVTAVWDANTDPYTIGYRLYIGTAPNRVDADIDVGSATSYPIDLPPGRPYYFVVRAYNQAGQLGPASNLATFNGAAPTAAPGAPGGLNVQVAGSRATLSWSAPSSGGTPSGYAVFVGTSPGSSNVLNGVPVGTGLSVSSNVSPGTYYVRLVAYNAAGASAHSQEVSFQVAGARVPGVPAGVSVSLSGTVATLSWVPPAPDSGPTAATSYVIEVGTAPGARNIGAFNIGNTTRFSSQVQPGVYYVRVRAVNAAGSSPPSAEVVLRYGTPGRPRSLVSSGKGSSVTLSWLPPTDGTHTGYILEVGSAPGLANLVVAPVGNTTTLTTSAPAGVYYVRVRALNGAGAGAASNEIVVRR